MSNGSLRPPPGGEVTAATGNGPGGSGRPMKSTHSAPFSKRGSARCLAKRLGGPTWPGPVVCLALLAGAVACLRRAREA